MNCHVPFKLESSVFYYWLFAGDVVKAGRDHAHISLYLPESLMDPNLEKSLYGSFHKQGDPNIGYGSPEWYNFGKAHIQVRPAGILHSLKALSFVAWGVGSKGQRDPTRKTWQQGVGVGFRISSWWRARRSPSELGISLF